MDIEARGAAGIAEVAAAVRRLGSSRVIVNNMAKEIRRAVPPIRGAIRTNAVAYLPARGGFGKWVAKGKITARISRSARSAGVTIVDGRNSQNKRTDMKRINAGSTRHKTFGRPPWHPQTVRSGFFDDAITDEGAAAFRAAVDVAVVNAINEVIGNG